MYFDYSLFREHGLYSLMKPVIKLLSHVVYSSRCEGRENVPLQGRLIVACNHIGTPDPAFIVANCPRRLHYMAKSEIFSRKSLALFFSLMNAFPVVRSSADRKALRYALGILERDWVLGIFPEGRRVRSSESASPVDALSGVGYIARLSGADVLPCCLYRPVNQGRFRPRVEVIFGRVIRNSELGFRGENKSKENKAAAALIMNEIRQLWEKADRNFRNEEGR